MSILHSKKSEICCIKTLLCNDIKEKFRLKLLAAIDSDQYFGYPPCKAAYNRIVLLLKKRQELVTFEYIIEDPALEAEFRAILADADDVSECADGKQVTRLIDTLERYRKMRAIYNISFDTIEGLKKEKFDVDTLIENMTTAVTNARQISTQSEEICVIGLGGNSRDHLIASLDKKNPLIKTGYTAYDNFNGGLPKEGVMLIAASTSGGKCLEGKTLINTEIGMYTISELWEMTDYKTQDYDGFRDFVVNLYSHTGVVPSSKMYHTTGETLKLVTNTGHHIEGLPEHKVWVYDEVKCVNEFKMLSEICPGDSLPRTLGCNIFSKVVPEINTDKVNSEFEAIRRDAYREGNLIVSKKLPKKMTLPLAKLLGYIVSEGSGLRISNTDNDTLEDIYNCAVECFGKRAVLSREDHINIQFKHLQLFFEEIGYVKCTSAKQKIPLIIRKSPKEYQAAFLQSLFEGDGSIYREKNSNRFKLEYTSISRKLIDELLVMLENFGIACHVIKGSTWASNGSSNQVSKVRYRLFVEKSHIAEFIEQIGFISTKKRKLCDDYIAHRSQADASSAQNTVYYSTGFTNYLPVRKLLTKLCDTIQLEITPSSIFGSTLRVLSGDRKISRYTVNKVLKKRSIVLERTSNSDIIKLFDLLEDASNYVYSSVVSIRPTNKTKDVYDFSVPGPHSYSANGLMSHNSAMLLNLLKNIYLINKLDVSKVTFEMSKEQELNRLFSNLARVPYDKFVQGTLTKLEKRKVVETHDKFFDFGVKNQCRFASMSPERSMGIDDIFITLKPYGYNVIGVDYLSLLKGMDSERQWYIMGKVTADSKAFSRKNHCLVILLAQLDTKTDEVRYSRAVQENVDVAWQWNYSKEEDRKNKILPIMITKARDGKTGSFHLRENFDYMDIENIDDEDLASVVDDDINDDELLDAKAGIS